MAQSLENISLLSVCSMLWRNRSLIGRMSYQMMQCYLQEDHADYHAIADIVWDDMIILINLLVSRLSLPSKLARKVQLIMTGTKREIIRWVINLDFGFGTRYKGYSRSVYYLSYIQWSFKGTIDYEATAENLINNGNFSNVEKFIIACTFCLPNYVVDLAPKISSFLNNYNGSRNAMVNYWVCYLKDGLDEMEKYALNLYSHEISVPEFMLYEILWTNEAAVYFFWKQLSEQDKLIFITVNIDQFEYFSSNILYRMLDELNERFREDLFRTIGGKLLMDLSGNFLSHERYYLLLHRMRHVMTIDIYEDVIVWLTYEIQLYGENVEAYQNFFHILQQTWSTMSPAIKKSFFVPENKTTVMNMLNALSLDNSVDFIEMILHDGGQLFKKDIILNRKIGKDIFFALLKKNDVDYVKRFLKSLGTNFFKIKDFKKSFMNSHKHDIALYYLIGQRAFELEEFLMWMYAHHKTPKQSVRVFKKTSHLVLFEKLLRHEADKYNNGIPDFNIFSHFFNFITNIQEKSSIRKITKKLPHKYSQYVNFFLEWFENRSN